LRGLTAPTVTFRLPGLVAACACAASCLNPAAPTPTLALSCPVVPAVTSVDDKGAPVTFTAPTPTGGSAPVALSCDHATGDTVPVGSTTVTCQAADATRLSVSCAFSVVVHHPPLLATTRFVAFGDSLTEGKLASTAVTDEPYPVALQRLLAGRYPVQAQAITVVNRGCGGETADAGGPCGGGITRLGDVLTNDQPAAILLLEGGNDLFWRGADGVDRLSVSLRAMVQQAQARGVIVFLATLPPARSGGTPPRGERIINFVSPANERIRQIAITEHVFLVDLFEQFGGTPDPLIDVDGLHATSAGYRTIAQAFFDAIREHLERREP
jgi:lysophospholipase L1-like esterase